MNSARMSSLKPHTPRERMNTADRNLNTGHREKDSRFSEILSIEITKFDKVDDVILILPG